MATTIITTQTLPQGTERLVLYRHEGAYWLAHVDRRQTWTVLPDAQFWTYAAAQERLSQEMQERRPVCTPS